MGLAVAKKEIFWGLLFGKMDHIIMEYNIKKMIFSR